MTSVDRLRDELAGRLGWTNASESHRQGKPFGIVWVRDDGTQIFAHPIPATLDACAAIWREHCGGWRFTMEYTASEVWKIEAWPVADAFNPSAIIHVDEDTELEARLAMLVACVKAKGGKT